MTTTIRMAEVTRLDQDDNATYIADSGAATNRLAAIDIFRGPVGGAVTGRVHGAHATVQLSPNEFDQLRRDLAVGDEVRIEYVVVDTAKVVQRIVLPNLSPRRLLARVEELTALVHEELGDSKSKLVELKQQLGDVLQALRRGGATPDLSPPPRPNTDNGRAPDPV